MYASAGDEVGNAEQIEKTLKVQIVPDVLYCVQWEREGKVDDFLNFIRWNAF